jgi:hypothetical protein
MKIELSVPKYDLILPSNGEKVVFRPFLMREEKLLLFASESNNEPEVVAAVDEIVRNCTEEKISASTHSVFDLIYVFIQIRAKSVAEVAEFNLVCGACEHQTESTINLTEIKVEKTEGHSNVIMLSDTAGIKMRYPRLSDAMGVDLEDLDSIYHVIVNCMETVFDGDEINVCADVPREELLAFLDTLSLAQFSEIEKFFETMPKISSTLDYTCPKCQKENTVVLDSLLNFFA